MSFIYTGVWINWSHGLVAGSTLTLSERDGGLLTAFLAIFVSAAGAAAWKLMSYALHQSRARQEYQDGLHHQQQAILRNSHSPVGASWQLMQLTWFWRRNATRYLMRTIPLAGLALLNLALFGVAGVFSSQVTKAPGNETLVRSSNCGIVYLKHDIGPIEGEAKYHSLATNDTIPAAAYQRACYDNTENLLQCGQYIQRQLRWTSNPTSPCPFSPQMCYSGDMTAYEMDTGLIDSHDDLGINAPKMHRIQYRKVTTCSPIPTKDFRTEFINTDINSPTFNDTFVRYFYGNVGGANYTYQYNKHSIVGVNGYKLMSFIYIPPNSTVIAWNPIPALRRTDADVSLLLLAPNSILYDGPVNDPFYLATTPSTDMNISSTDTPYYTSDRYVNVMGCIDQHQFCNPATGNCTELTASDPVFRAIPTIGLNEAQTATATRLGVSGLLMSTYFSVEPRGVSAFRASETIHDVVQIALPDNQWILEVSSWFGVSLARLQQKAVQYATGPSYDIEVEKPRTKEEINMCKNQIIRSPGGTISFSVLGLCIIFIIGGILIVTSLVIDTLVGFIRRQLDWKKYKSLQWTLDEKLQLQRLAYEEAGQGHWDGCSGSVPVMKKDDRIGVPKHVNDLHPRLSQRSDQSEQVVAASDDMAEAEGLMARKQMAYGVEELH